MFNQPIRVFLVTEQYIVKQSFGNSKCIADKSVQVSDFVLMALEL